MPDKILYCRLPPHLKEQAQQEAKRLSLSLTAFIRLLVADYFDIHFSHKEATKK